MSIDKAKFDIWLDNPVTKDILKSLALRKIAKEEYLARELSFDNLNYDHYRSFAINCFVKGQVAAYNELLGISFDDFQRDKEGADEQIKTD